MYFNELMSIGNIISAYRTDTFPDAYCLLTGSLEDIRLLSTENMRLIDTEDERSLRLDGVTRIHIH